MEVLNYDLDKNNIPTRIDNFRSLLKDIETLDDKKRQLWIEIYTNAIVDRQTAYANYQQLLSICADKSSEHAVHGRTMAAFLERMCKANDQLIKLAALIADAQIDDDEKKKPKPKDLYNFIAGNNAS